MFIKCYEVDPFSLSDQFKSTLKIINPFQRIHKEIDTLLSLTRGVNDENKVFNRKNFEKLVEDYYIYKIQYKKYGLTFYIMEEIENNQSDNEFFLGNKKQIFINEAFSNDLSDFLDLNSLDFLRHNLYHYDLVTLEQQKMISNFQPGKKVIKYIDPERLFKIKRTKETLLSIREIINLNRIKEIPFLFKRENLKRRVGENYDYYEDLKQSIEDSPETSYNKKDFIKMLNIMYEDQYLVDFTYEFYEYEECYDFYEKDYKKKYLEEYIERNEDYKDYGGYDDYFNMFEKDFLSLKDYKMSSRFMYIETKNVVYELEDWADIKSYRRIIIFDPINNNYIVPIDKQIDNLYCIRKIKK